MKTVLGNFIRLLFHILIGNALVLIAAVREYGETEFSERLLPRLGDVPEMIEALLMSALIIVVGGFIASLSEKELHK